MLTQLQSFLQKNYEIDYNPEQTGRVFAFYPYTGRINPFAGNSTDNFLFINTFQDPRRAEGNCESVIVPPRRVGNNGFQVRPFILNLIDQDSETNFNPCESFPDDQRASSELIQQLFMRSLAKGIHARAEMDCFKSRKKQLLPSEIVKKIWEFSNLERHDLIVTKKLIDTLSIDLSYLSFEIFKVKTLIEDAIQKSTQHATSQNADIYNNFEIVCNNINSFHRHNVPRGESYPHDEVIETYLQHTKEYYLWSSLDTLPSSVLKYIEDTYGENTLAKLKTCLQGKAKNLLYKLEKCKEFINKSLVTFYELHDSKNGVTYIDIDKLPPSLKSFYLSKMADGNLALREFVEGFFEWLNNTDDLISENKDQLTASDGLLKEAFKSFMKDKSRDDFKCIDDNVGILVAFAKKFLAQEDIASTTLVNQNSESSNSNAEGRNWVEDRVEEPTVSTLTDEANVGAIHDSSEDLLET